ncbi:NAD-dependent succinate-semialdehyde dehydrogenase [Candidatus Binatus sp.]|uniref:NAD-dependent succinate-semialdehyde dehydrogenase n=3 Tax=Candidatus Binatus sp. TaxID=2811406 RepID=UPI003BAE868B
MRIESINPATEELLASFDEINSQELDRRVTHASEAFRSWRKVPISDRARCMNRMSEYLLAHKEKLARIATVEMGKPIRQSLAEVEKCALGCRFYAENGERFLASTPIETGSAQSYVEFDPVGIVLAIMPWNFPFWQVFRFAAPALVAGNVALLKHAPNVPQSAIAIEHAFREVGFPEHVFQTLLVGVPAVERIIADDRVQAITLTGSELAGSKVAESSGRHLKKTVLELGGSDPFIVLSDADVDAAAACGALARNQNGGQSCIAAKRFIVLETVADKFMAALTRHVEDLRTGDPEDPATDVGPLARSDLREKLEDQVERSVRAGARVVTGGTRLSRKGYFYAPTILTDLSRDAPVLKEETFGPVAPIIRVKDLQSAVALANDTHFGLGASLWTRDMSLAREIARELETGMVFVNGMVASDPRLPFGGVKRSGYGRELSDFGIREFTNIKTVSLANSVSKA